MWTIKRSSVCERKPGTPLNEFTSNSLGTDNPTHILTGNVDQVTQLTNGTTENGENMSDKILQLNIMTESEAAQFAAQLSQHGVIVRGGVEQSQVSLGVVNQIPCRSQKNCLVTIIRLAESLLGVAIYAF